MLDWLKIQLSFEKISIYVLLLFINDMEPFLGWLYISFVVNLQWYKLKTPSGNDSDYKCVPYMRYGHTASLIGTKVYIFGGRNDQDGACNTLYCFDTGMQIATCFASFHLCLI